MILKWIEKRIPILILILVTVAVIEIGIGSYRLPKEFRNEIIPKLNRYLYEYEHVEKRLDMLMKLKELESYND